MSAKITIKSTPAVGFGGLVSIIVGLLMVVGGAVAWGMVSQQLAQERIYVSEDAPFLAGRLVSDPFSAYAQADAINKHALEASGGKTYAELAQDDPTRATVMNAAFLRSSLFTSVVSFGVAFLAFGTGVLFVIIGWALRRSAGGPPLTIETDSAGPVVVENQKGKELSRSEYSGVSAVSSDAATHLNGGVTDADAGEKVAVPVAPVAAAPVISDSAAVNPPSQEFSSQDQEASLEQDEVPEPAQTSRGHVVPLATSSDTVTHGRFESVIGVSSPEEADRDLRADQAETHNSEHVTESPTGSRHTFPSTSTFSQVPAPQSSGSDSVSPVPAPEQPAPEQPAPEQPATNKPALSLETGPLPVVPSFDDLIAPENSASISRVSRSERLIGESRRKVEDERARTGMTGTIPIVGETRRSRSQASAASPAESSTTAGAQAQPQEDTETTRQDNSTAEHEPRPVTGAISWQSPEDRLK